MKTVHAFGLLTTLLRMVQGLRATGLRSQSLLDSLAGRLWSVEMKRRNFMRLSAGAAYPCPAEERVLTFSVLGVPVWCSRSAVGLPAETDARIEAIQAHEFDAAFEPRFRTATPAGRGRLPQRDAKRR
jgi:hypothetical protein